VRMLVSDVPNIGMELLVVHAVISRGMKVAAEHGRRFLPRGYPNASVREGFLSYVRTFVSVLHAHHLVEEELAFPRLRDKFPEIPYDLLLAQHRGIMPVLDEIGSAVEDVAADLRPGESLRKLTDALNRIALLWHPHIRLEEEHLTVEKAQARLSAEEQTEWTRLFMEHSQQHALPDYLVVAFMLYNLPPAERSIFAREMPPIVTEQLVPIVWREKWEPMMPFLLT
jgi:hypothetical protein